MIKSILYIVMMLPLFFSCMRNSDHIIFQYVDPLEKILPEQTLFMARDAMAHVARGEYATFQFVVRCNQNITGLQANMNVFLRDRGDKRSRFNGLKISYVGLVHEGRSSIMPGTDNLIAPSNYYPDPLLDDARIDVPANISSAIWVSIPIDKNVIPGVYKSDLTITGKENGLFFKKSIPVTLKVYSTVIDTQSLMISNWHQSSFDYVEKDEIPSFSPRWWELVEELADLMVEYKQNVVLISPLKLADYKFNSKGEVVEITFEKFDRLVDFFKSKEILKIAGGHIAQRLENWDSQFGYIIPTQVNGRKKFITVGHDNMKGQKFSKVFFTALYAHLKKKGWTDNYIQHIADEPIQGNADSYISIAAQAQKYMPGIKIIDAILTPDVHPSVDILVPQLDKLDSDFAAYQNQQNQGKEVWFYTCVWPQGEYANRYIRQPLLKTRLLHWINFKYDISGYLHWGMNFWQGENPMVEVSAIQPNGTVSPGGDAWIIYPYKKHLIPSIRLDAMRDGIMDYELLKILKKHNPDFAKNMVEEIVFGFKKYDTNISHFRQIRIQILEELEFASKSYYTYNARKK